MELIGLGEQLPEAAPKLSRGGPDEPWWYGFPNTSGWDLSLTDSDSDDESGSRDSRAAFPPYKYMPNKYIGRKKEGLARQIKPFPFVGKRRPPQTLGCKIWDKWEDSFAYCVENTVFIGRCNDDTPNAWEPLPSITIAPKDPNGTPDTFLALDWTIDPFTLQPLIIVGGRQKMLYVLDCSTREIRREIKGHGEQINCIAAHPTLFHIVASGSRDISIRIWNILGVPAERPGSGKVRQENYAQADAEEGSVVVAVLAGRCFGGHVDEVLALAWHPRHRAIASGGRDHEVKVWPIPPLPAASRNHTRPTPRSVRPIVISTPLFSTERSLLAPISDIAWISHDCLLLTGHERGMIIQWSGYARYFDRGKSASLIDGMDDVQASDWDNSGSFTIVRKFRTSTGLDNLKIGYHARFTPTSEEADDINLVTDHLYCTPHLNRDSVANIRLFAIGLTPPNKPPKVSYRKPTTIEILDEAEFGVPQQTALDQSSADTDHLSLTQTDFSQKPLVSTQRPRPKPNKRLATTARRISVRMEKYKDKDHYVIDSSDSETDGNSSESETDGDDEADQRGVKDEDPPSDDGRDSRFNHNAHGSTSGHPFRIYDDSPEPPPITIPDSPDDPPYNIDDDSEDEREDSPSVEPPEYRRHLRSRSTKEPSELPISPSPEVDEEDQEGEVNAKADELEPVLGPEFDEDSDYDYRSDSTVADPSYTGPPYKWTLSTPDLQASLFGAAASTRNGLGTEPARIDDWLQACAISPRGAKWIVAVGHYGLVVVWRRRDVETE